MQAKAMRSATTDVHYRWTTRALAVIVSMNLAAGLWGGGGANSAC
jgi:hypothetical protein